MTTTHELKPMDPERLARARAACSPAGHSWLRALLAELLADRDYHAQRADTAERESVRLADRLDGHDSVETLSPEQWIGLVAGTGSPLDRLIAFDRAYVTHYRIGVLIKTAEDEIAAMRAEVARLRARVRVEAEDVGELPPSPIIAYLTALGWAEAHVVAREGEPLWTVMIKGDRGLDVPMLAGAVDYRPIIARIVNELAQKEGRVALDILDEMAAMEVPS